MLPGAHSHGQYIDVVFRYVGVSGNQRQSFESRLGYQHAVEWIAVVHW
jgi:hypothetical protein